MRSSFTQLYLHCVWGMWDRLPLITPDLERSIYACILDRCQALKCRVLSIGGMSDHVHLLVRIPATISVAELVKDVKGASSHLITHHTAPGEFFKWQASYGAFTVSKSAIPEVKAYIERQKQHHAENTIRPELEQTVSDE